MHYRTSTNKRLVIELGLIKWCGLVMAAAPAAVAPMPAANAQPAAAPRPATPATQPIQTKQAAPAMPSMPAIPTIPSIRPTGQATSNAATSGGQGQIATIDKQETQRRPFTKDQFNDAWIGLKRHFPREERLQAILSMCEPQIDGEKIRIGVSNPWQKEEIQRLREAMLAFLRQTLQNEGIEMDVVIDESRQQHTAYTAEEKMKRMQKEYPELTAFRQSLGLIIE